MVDIQLAPRPTRVVADPVRIVLTVISLGTLVWALGVEVFGVVALVAQLAAGHIQPTMYWLSDQYSFTSLGFENSPVQIRGAGGATVTTVSGASSGTVAVYVLATLVGLLTQATLGALAFRLLRRLRAAQPFRDAAWREVAAFSGILVVLGVGTQLLAWWTRVAVISDANGSTSFSTAFQFEPLSITIGLVLALVAIAFRHGERLQDDAEGVV